MRRIQWTVCWHYLTVWTVSWLMLSGFMGCAGLPLPGRTPEPVMVLYSEQDALEFRVMQCGRGQCRQQALERFRCKPTQAPVPTVVLNGHSLPPLYVGGTAERAAAAIACFRPELVVLDTCYGFSEPLLSALVAQGVQAQVIGATFMLPTEGLQYAPAFFTSAPLAVRQDAVQTRSGAPLQRWVLSSAGLEAVRAQVAGWSIPTLKANLQRVLPNLVRVPLPEGQGMMLVDVPPERFRSTEAQAEALP